MPKLPSLPVQLNLVRGRICTLFNALPPPPQGESWIPAATAERSRILVELGRLLSREKVLLRRIRYTARRRAENACWAARHLFRGRAHLLMPFLDQLRTENPALAIELAQASGARLAKLARIHLMPLAEQASFRAPMPWEVPACVVQATVGTEVRVVSPPGSREQDCEILPPLSERPAVPQPLRATKRKGGRRGRRRRAA